MQTPFRLGLTPLAVAGILITTAIPLELGGPSTWAWSVSPADLLQNLLLYAPLGVALWRQPLRRVALYAALLSLAIEFSQRWDVDRYPSMVDVLANTLGAFVTAWMWQRFLATRREYPVQVRVTLPRLGLVTGIALLIVLAWQSPVKPIDLSGWDATYPLLIGNERTPDRPWKGTIWSLLLQSGSGATTNRPSIGLDTAVVLNGDAISLSPGQVGPLVDAVQSANAFALAATISTADLEQRGPARIVSLSGDTLHRNFDLGQEGTRLVFRLRNQFTGLNGESGRLVSPPVLVAGGRVAVVASFDGRIARLVVNERLVRRKNYAATGCRITAACDWALPAAWSMVGGTAALLALALIPASSALWILTICLAAAILPFGYVSTLPVFGLVRGTHGWLPLLGLAGGLVAASARIHAIQRSSSAGG